MPVCRVARLFVLSLGLCLGLPPASAVAQEARQCVAPIRMGTWIGTQTDATTIVDLVAPGGAMLWAVPPSGDVAPVGLEGDACSAGFTIQHRTADGIPLTFPMTLQDWTDEHGHRYVGSDTVQGIQMTFDIRFDTPDSGAGSFEIVVANGLTRLSGTPFVVLQSQAPADAEPVACACRDELQNWIDRQVDLAQELQSAFDNEAWRERPDNWDGGYGEYTVRDYKRIIPIIVSDEVSFERATEIYMAGLLDGTYDSTRTQVDTKMGDGGLTVGGYTDLTNCKANYGTGWRRSCYPQIDLAMMETHESAHIEDCMAPGVTPETFQDIAFWGESEVKAYGRQVDWLQGWIPENCSG